MRPSPFPSPKISPLDSIGICPHLIGEPPILNILQKGNKKSRAETPASCRIATAQQKARSPATKDGHLFCCAFEPLAIPYIQYFHPDARFLSPLRVTSQHALRHASSRQVGSRFWHTNNVQHNILVTVDRKRPGSAKLPQCTTLAGSETCSAVVKAGLASPSRRQKDAVRSPCAFHGLSWACQSSKMTGGSQHDMQRASGAVGSRETEPSERQRLARRLPAVWRGCPAPDVWPVGITILSLWRAR